MRIQKLFITKLVTLIVVLSMLLATLNISVVKGASEENSITVFSSEDYISEAYDEDPECVSVLEVFEEQTGIKVNYLTFATNEEMYNELLKDPTACDLMCTSEYMIMKLINEDLIQEFEMTENQKLYGSKYINSVFKGLKIENAQGVEVPLMRQDESKAYAAGYMWGTIGLIYNMNLSDGRTLTDSDFEHWSSIWNNFNGRVTIKDSIRDSYFLALAKVYEDELMTAKAEYESTKDQVKYNEQLSTIFNRTDNDTIAKVEEALIELKHNLYGFEVDAGKSDILTGKLDVNFAWSGDAVYAIDQGLEAGMQLGYAVPVEGTNVWFDGFVMTKNAKSDKAIQFINFISDPEIAVLNMDYTGYTSCVAGNADNNVVFEYVVESYGVEEGEDGMSVDLSYFFNPDHDGSDYEVTVSDEYLPMFKAQYPDEDVIRRSAVMRNFTGEELARVNNMWKRIKLITLSNTVIWLIVAGVVLVAGGVVVYKYRAVIFAKWQGDEPKQKKRKYKVVKIEKLN